MLLYVGPEVVLPLASMAAAVLGGLLFCWRWIANLFRRVWLRLTRRGGAEDESQVTDELTGAGDSPVTR